MPSGLAHEHGQCISLTMVLGHGKQYACIRDQSKHCILIVINWPDCMPDIARCQQYRMNIKSVSYGYEFVRCTLLSACFYEPSTLIRPLFANLQNKCSEHIQLLFLERGIPQRSIFLFITVILCPLSSPFHNIFYIVQDLIISSSHPPEHDKSGLGRTYISLTRA